MKKRIIIGLSVFTLLLFLGGLYIIATIEKTTATLDSLIKLHQVEILRENLLIRIKRVQNDLNLKNTRYARGVDTIVADVRNMGKTANSCFGCHHSERVGEKINSLKNQIEHYKEAISRVLTITANINRLEGEEDNAFKIGEELVATVNTMIDLTSKRLEEKTKLSLDDIARIKIILFALVAVSPLIIAGIGFIFIRELTKPINVLLSATRSLKSGNLDHRIEGLKDEFGEVADSFNEMSSSLKEQIERLQRTEQVKVCGEMATSLAHELKNLLAGLKIALQMLLEDKNLSDSENEIAHVSFSQIKKIELLVRDLLDFARPKEPEYSIISINGLVEKTVSFLEAVSAQSTGNGAVKVVRSLAPDVPDIFVDPVQIQQAIMNIVLNAYEAMPDGGRMNIETTVENASIAITVADTGSGIDGKDMEKIFKPFFTTKIKGTGLGLPITKGIIERHGGRIEVSSEPGRGTRVALYLPLNAQGSQKAN